MKENVVQVLGCRYLHQTFESGDEIYLTPFGLPWQGQLSPDMFWTDRDWFAASSHKLFGHEHQSGGSGTVYRVRTKVFDGKSKEIVLKWNRMAQEVPGWRDDEKLTTAEFNSPFEEFSLVLEMREAFREISERRMLTHKPLAIYVPAKKVEPDRQGRKEYAMREIIRKHPEVQLDVFRRYAVIYEWIKGQDIQAMCRDGIVSGGAMAEMTLSVDQDLARLGFSVRDRKPQHVICRLDTRDGAPVRRRGQFTYGLVDFELLERTGDRERIVKAARRKEYLVHQAKRFEPSERDDERSELQVVNIMGVDYVYGTVGSTGGRLWVVGRDPVLFDYFLPERWEHTRRTKLSPDDEVYETTTKDNIHIVWKLSHVGEYPDVDPFDEKERRILEHGYNSPFEKVQMAVEFQSRGRLTTMPRAIYETSHRSGESTVYGDQSRYITHQNLITPDGLPVLRSDRDYIVAWGYWNKPDSSLADDDKDHYEPIDALRALQAGILTRDEYMALMHRIREDMEQLGFEDLSFSGRHKLLSLDKTGQLIRDEEDHLEVHITNFELVRRLA